MQAKRYCSHLYHFRFLIHFCSIKNKILIGFSITVSSEDMYGDTEALTDDQLTSTVTVGTNGDANCQGDFGDDGTVTIAADWNTCGIAPTHTSPYILYDANVAATSPMYVVTDENGQETEVKRVLNLHFCFYTLID